MVEPVAVESGGASAPEAEPLVSVVIGTKDRPEELLTCLRSIEKQDYRRIEVVILDDGSRNASLCDVVGAAGVTLAIRCHRVEESLGVAGGRNYLMEQAHGAIIIVLDDDAVFASKSDVCTVVATFAALPDAGMIAFKIVNHGVGGDNLMIPFNRRSLKANPKLSETPCRVSYYLGGGHALRKQMLQKTGVYQSDLMYYGEELDLAFRVINAGLSIHYCPSVVIDHYPPQHTAGVFDAARYFYALRNAIWIGYRYLPFPNVASYLVAWIANFCLVGIRNRQIGTFVKALKAGFAGFRRMDRVVLSSDAMRYLRRNYGRLWY